MACTVALLSLPVFGASSAHAASELTVSPTILELDAEAGETITQPISVSAGPDSPITVQLVHADFGFNDDGYQVTLIRDDAPETTAFSTRDWFSLPKRTYRIAKASTAELPLRIKIPKNTPGGTYLGAALIRIVPPGSTSGASQVQAVPETGPLLFISVAGGAPPKAKLERFAVPSRAASGPIRPDIVVENVGDEFFTYEGEITLSGPGKDDTVKVSRQFVVPGQPRRVRTSPDERGAAGRPKLGSDKLGFGRYEVTTKLRIEPTGTKLVSTRTIWIVPTWVWITGAILAIIAAVSIALLVQWVLRRRRSAAAASDTEPELGRAGVADDDLDEHAEDPAEDIDDVDEEFDADHDDEFGPEPLDDEDIDADVDGDDVDDADADEISDEDDPWVR